MPRFSTTFIICGSLFALFHFIHYWGSDLILTILMSLGAGSAFGALLGLVTYFVGQSLPMRTLPWLGLIIVVGGTAFVAGNVITFSFDKLPHTNWYPLDPAPEKPVRFVGQPPFYLWGDPLYVATEAGGVLAHTCDSYSSCTWERLAVLPPQSEEYFRSCGPEFRGPRVPPPVWGRVIDRFEANACEVEAIVQLNLVLLDDGTLLAWSAFSDIYGLLFSLVLSSLLSPVIAVIGVIGILIRTRGNVG